MAVDVRQNLTNVERLQKELAEEVAGLPGALHSFTPELLVDYLAATFKEGDNEPKSWSATPCTALKEEEEEKWSSLAAMMQEGPSCSKAVEEAAAMDAAAERIQATILEMERTSVAPVEEMGLPAGEEDDKGLLLVRCKTCARVLLAGSLAAHEEQCRSAPAPFRPAASPAPSSTTASMPASSGPASISQGKPASARRKKAANVPKSKLGPGKKQGAAEAGKALPCSTAARQAPQLMRPPLYPGPAKAPAGQQQLFAPQHMAPRFAPEDRNRPGSTSGMGVPQPANSRHPAQHGVAANGGVPSSHQWASLQIPHNFPGGGFDDLSLDWLDDPGGMLAPNASSAQVKARSAPSKPAQSRALPAPQAPKRRRPSDNSLGPFLPHPRRLRSVHPKRRLARMLTLPYVSTDSPGRIIPMPTPQKQRASGGGRPAPHRQNLPSSNGPVASTQQQTFQQQQLHHHQQMAWQMANSRAQQQPSQQAQRQSALRQPAIHQPSAEQNATRQQQQPRHQHQQQHTPQQQRSLAPNSVPMPQGSSHSLVQHWASNGMQVIPPGAYMLPQQLPAGGARTSYMVPHMQPQASTAQHTNSQSSAQRVSSSLGYQQAQQAHASTAKNVYSQSSAMQMPSSLGYQQTQQPQRHPQQQQQQQQQHQQQYYQQMQHGSRMVPVHNAQQRVAQNAAQNGQAGAQHMQQRISMQRMMPDNFVPLGCADGGAQRVDAVNALKRSYSGEPVNGLKRSYSGDPGLLPPTKKLASLQHQALPMLRPEEFKPF